VFLSAFSAAFAIEALAPRFLPSPALACISTFWTVHLVANYFNTPMRKSSAIRALKICFHLLLTVKIKQEPEKGSCKGFIMNEY
jgi:hypothetical protein